MMVKCIESVEITCPVSSDFLLTAMPAGDNDFFVGDSVTVADMTVFDVLNNFSFNLFPSVKANFAKLSAFYDRIAALPAISAYMASEKYTCLMAFPCLE